MDGPRAWAIVCQAMRSNERSDADKNFYLDALHLQRTVYTSLQATRPMPVPGAAAVNHDVFTVQVGSGKDLQKDGFAFL